MILHQLAPRPEPKKYDRISRAGIFSNLKAVPYKTIASWGSYLTVFDGATFCEPEIQLWHIGLTLA